jgi:hypothetical protein
MMLTQVEEKFKIAKENLIAEFGWVRAHRDWLIACLCCLLLGLILGHFLGR